MNDIDRINDDIEKIVAFLASNTHILVQNSDLIKQIAERQVKPTQPEGYQGLNKWYRTNMGHIIYAVQLNYFNCYGIRVKTELNRETGWCNDFALNPDIIDRLATESEIKEAILKGCEQNGIVEGAVVTLGAGIFKIELGNIEYVESTNALWMSYNNEGGLDCGKVRVFGNGKFAEVVKEENNHRCTKDGTTAVCDKCFNARNNSKPTDKELLKECLEVYGNLLKGMNLSDVCRGKFKHFQPEGTDFYKQNENKAYVGSKGIPNDEEIVKAVELQTKLNERLTHD